MSNDSLAEEGSLDIQFFEDDIPVRGCSFSLTHIKSVYRELDSLSKNEADRLLGGLSKSHEQSDEEFEAFKRSARERAFRLTVSIIGEDGQTSYGESEEIFDSKTLPFPIATIFFTNENSFKNAANGQSP